MTAEGERVVACIVGREALMLADTSGEAFKYAQKLKSLGACGSSGEESPNRDYSRNNNHLDQSGDLFDPSQQGINWEDICRNPVVDAIVSEPCSSLTTSSGYQLTAQGKRVVACIAGGGVLMLADPTGQALAYAQSLKSTFGCGGASHDRVYSEDNYQSRDLFDRNNPKSLGNQLDDFGNKLNEFINPSQGSRGSNQNPIENLMGNLFGNN